MYHPSQEMRASTMAISESIKYRKNCLLEGSPSKFSLGKRSFINQQNIPPLFDKDSKCLNASIDLKRESRRKAGSIVKIARNIKSSEKNQQSAMRNELGDGSNYLNSKLQYHRSNQESIGVYKKLYEENKVLNETLKSKIYQSNEKTHFTNPLIGLSSISYCHQGNQMPRKNLNPNEDFIKQIQHKQQQHVFNSKYQKMLEEYDKKKNFIKEEMQAMKQKSSLQNFSAYDKNLNQQAFSQIHLQSSYKDQSLEKSKLFTLDQRLKSIQGDSSFKGSYSDKKESMRTFSSGFKIKQQKQNQKQVEIDKKFKAYQSKLQKHKDFEKRNSSVGRKDLNQHFVDKLSVKNPVSSSKIQLSNIKSLNNDSLKVFIDLIGKQIQKDEEVRVLKHHLKHINISEIESILKERFQIASYPQNFKLNTEEYDPFFQLQKSEAPIEQTIRKLIGAIEFADNFWKNLICGRLNNSDLEYVFDTLNYGKREQIGMNQLAREFSFHLGKTVRNKEIYLIYQRLCPMTKENFISRLEGQNK